MKQKPSSLSETRVAFRMSRSVLPVRDFLIHYGKYIVFLLKKTIDNVSSLQIKQRRIHTHCNCSEEQGYVQEA